MGRNRLDDPPAVSSEEEHLHEEEDDAEGIDTDDDKGSGSESESESSSEDEAPPQLPKSLPKNPIPDSGDETESENETMGSPGLSGFTIHKHVVTSPDSVKAKTPVLKRPLPTEGKKKDSTAKKTKVENGERRPLPTEVKKSTIQVWSDEDTVALLELIVGFIEEKGADPLGDGGVVFHDYVKGKLSFETSTSKLMEKIRRLKKKFVKMGEDGEDLVFTKPFDKKSWNLSKQIWGKAGVVLALQAKTLSSKRSSSSKKKTKENVNGGLVDGSKGENVVSSQLPPATEKADVKDEVVISRKIQADKKTVVTSELPLATEKTNGKDEAVVSRYMQEGENTDANAMKFSRLYPYLCQSLKDGNAHMSLVLKDWAEAMEENLCHLEKSKLEELEGEWKKQILGEIEFSLGRASILLKQVGMVKDLH